MNGLGGARVLMLDDNPAEVLPVIKSFAKKGVGVAFFDGSLSQLPPKPERLTGIRLAILDIDLGEGEGDANKASTLVNRFARLISPQNGPYAVILWTNHEELRDLVKKYMYSHAELPNPLFTETITKAECASGDLTLIATKISAALGSIGALESLQNWEWHCHRAASAVTNTLNRIANPTGTDLDSWCASWQRELEQLLKAMAIAKAEKQLSMDNCLNAVFTTLNPLHADRMERSVDELCETLMPHAPPLMACMSMCTMEQKARINTMFHLGFQNLSKLAPGNTYAFTSRKKPGWMPKCAVLTEGFLQLPKGANPGQVKERLDEVCASAIPVAIEFSAACDHAQMKLQSARLIPGLLMPEKKKNLVNTGAEFIKTLGPIYINGGRVDAGTYFICLNSRQVFSVALEKIAPLRAFARIRSQALAELQAWYGYHVSRQGTTMLK